MKLIEKTLTLVHKYGKYIDAVRQLVDVKSYEYEVHFSNKIALNTHRKRMAFDHRANEFVCDFREILDELRYSHTHNIYKTKRSFTKSHTNSNKLIQLLESIRLQMPCHMH